MNQINALIQRLDSCPLGTSGWVEFEEVCVEILKYLFDGALSFNSRQARTYSGVNRRDAIFSNRNLSPTDKMKLKNWHHLYLELGARLILFEFKNYDVTEVGHEEVNQTRNYLTAPMGKLAIMICSKAPNEAAHRQRNSIYSSDEKKGHLIFNQGSPKGNAMDEGKW